MVVVVVAVVVVLELESGPGEDRKSGITISGLQAHTSEEPQERNWDQEYWSILVPFPPLLYVRDIRAMIFQLSGFRLAA